MTNMTGGASQNRYMGRLSIIFLGGLVALVVSVSVAISLGSVQVPLGTVWGVFLNSLSPDLVEPSWSKGREAIVWDIRFPRALLAMMVGDLDFDRQ